MGGVEVIVKPIEEWLNKIHCGNAYELLKQMPSESVDCVITSPPYHGLRDYGRIHLKMFFTSLPTTYT